MQRVVLLSMAIPTTDELPMAFNALLFRAADTEVAALRTSVIATLAGKEAPSR